MGFQPSLRDLDLLPVDGPALKSMRENWVVPPGLRSFFPLFPALKRWAKLVRPSGAAFSSSSFHRIAKTSVLTHTLKRWAKLGRPSGAAFSSSFVLPDCQNASSHAHTKGRPISKNLRHR